MIHSLLKIKCKGTPGGRVVWVYANLCEMNEQQLELLQSI